MAGGSQGANDGVIQRLQKLYPEVAALAVAPDASQHMQFIQQLQQGILGYIRQDAQKQAQQQIQMTQQATQTGMGGGMPQQPGGQPGAPGAGGQQLPPQVLAALMARQGGAQPGGQPQGMGGVAPSAADELRRVLAGPAAVGG